MAIIRMRDHLYDEIVNYAKEHLPEEACGLLAGVENGEGREIRKVYFLENKDHAEDHFTLDPRDQINAIRDMRKAAFLSLLREYTKYLNFLGYDDYIPDDDYVVKRIAFNPYLFTDDELSGLFKMIDSYVGKTCGKRYLPEIVLPVYSRLLYCCGLRPQEPPAIRTEDVNLITGDVYIRQSKRHKDRHIIMSEDMRALCQKYDSVAGKRQWFFQKWDGTPYEASWYNQIWRNLISKSGISWKGTPRPYDLRHAFASRNIIRWINNGKDVMELLPYLSAYMEHSELTSTLYYIHLLPENLRKSKAVNWALLSQVYGKGGPEDED